MNFDQHSPQENSTFRPLKEDALHASTAAAEEAQKQFNDIKDAVSSKKDSSLEQVNAIEHALESAAQDLQDHDYTQLSSYVTQFAKSLGSTAESLRNKNIDEVFHSIQSVAQRNPTLFIVGSIAIGLGISRFIKASSNREARTQKSSSHPYNSSNAFADSKNTQGNFSSDRAYQSQSQEEHQPSHAFSASPHEHNRHQAENTESSSKNDRSLSEKNKYSLENNQHWEEDNHRLTEDFSKPTPISDASPSSNNSPISSQNANKENVQSHFTGQGFVKKATEEDYAADDFLGASHPQIEDDDWWRDGPDRVGKPRPVSKLHDGDRHYE